MLILHGEKIAFLKILQFMKMSMTNISNAIKKIQPTLIALIVFITLSALTLLFTQYKKGQWEKDLRIQLSEVLIGKKSELEKALYSRIYYTRGVAAYVALNPDITNEEYQELAKEYIGNDSVINTMALSKDAVINAIYPVEGHEEAIGLDLLGHPERKEIVQQTIETGLTFVAGPVELVEGGIAFISYTPIFDKTVPDNPFWGVTDIVIKKDELLNEANLNYTENGYNFALKGYNGEGENGALFWGAEQVFEQKPVKININLPLGNWVLAAIPDKGWEQYKDQDKTLSQLLFVSAFIISALIWLFANSVMKIRQNEKQLKAIFASLDSLIIELNSNGEYINIATDNEHLLALPKNKIIGKKVHDVFDKEMAGFFLHSINECLQSKKLVVIEYPLIIDGQNYWFAARISRKNENSVIFNAYDITEKKKKEAQLEASEKKLKELNKTKDKLFSIIAHDLRSPVAGQKSLTELLLEDYENLSDAKRREMLGAMLESSKGLYNLLQNLLEWSRAQSGKITADKKKINISAGYNALFKEMEIQAAQKNIELKINIPENTYVLADANMTEVILRNLVSNAIKFTHEKGKVELSREQITVDDKPFLKINVTDNGTGISEDRMNHLFQSEKNNSTPGTANEKGTGLGLVLCKEFIELQGGQIFVESKPDEGSTFSFTLPLLANK